MAQKPDIYAAGAAPSSPGTPPLDPSRLPTSRRVWRKVLTMLLVMIGSLALMGWLIHLHDEGQEVVVPDAAEVESISRRERMEVRLNALDVELPGSLDAEREVSPTAEVDQERMVKAMAKLRTAKDFLAEREFESAEMICHEALGLWPQMNGAMRMLGVVYWQRGQFAESIDMLLIALEENPFSAEIFNNLAMAHIQLGEVDQAQEYLETALDLNPNYAITQLNLGFLHLARARYDLAVDYIEQALQRFPNNVNARNNLGVALIRLGRYEEARSHLEMLTSRVPEVTDPYFNLAVVAVMEDDYPQALAWIKEGAAHCTLDQLQQYLSDPDLDDLRAYPEFLEFINEVFSPRPAS